MVIRAPGFSGEPLPIPPYRSVCAVAATGRNTETANIRAHRRVLFWVFSSF